jgi:hypothetical protein
MTGLRYATLVLATLAMGTPAFAATHHTADVERPVARQHMETYRDGVVHAYHTPNMPSQQRMYDPFSSLLLG